mmetsp:Transcript_12690/g.25863  ORF Transcript_12690/g.25863 Transcript_12690/m.25863 type:complete len:485 (-) Transcript_12690:116-1570(-)
MNKTNLSLAFSTAMALALSASGNFALATGAKTSSSTPPLSCSSPSNGECTPNDDFTHPHPHPHHHHYTYFDICTPPKSCPRGKCTPDVLEGLSAARTNLERGVASMSKTDPERWGRELELIHVRLEEASVGCALLYEYAGEGEVDPKSMTTTAMCPTPAICSHESGSCTMDVLRHLRRSRRNLEEALRLRGLDEDGLASHVGIGEMAVEEAAVGCHLMLDGWTRGIAIEERESADLRNGHHPAESEANDVTHETFPTRDEAPNRDDEINIAIAANDETPIFPSHEILQDEDALDMFLMRHFPDEMYHLGKIKVRRRNLQDILHFAGVGEIPDVWGEELTRREKQIEELLAEEASIRKTLLRRLHEMNSKRRKSFRSGEDDRESDATKAKGGRGGGRGGMANAFVSGNGRTSRDKAIETMEKDINFLKKKAGEATTGEERDARWRMVSNLEKNLIRMKKIRYAREGIPYDERPFVEPVTGEHKNL